MKVEVITQEIKFIDELYRITYFTGSMVMRIEIWAKYHTIFKIDRWKTIYFGHSDPLRKAIEFYDECRKQDNKP